MEKFSSGTILIDLDIQQITATELQYFLQVIHKLPSYGFVWLTNENNKSLRNKPQNLFLTQNLKNSNILSLEKHIKCFITTPEILRIQESLYYGVPMVTISQIAENRYVSITSILIIQLFFI